MRHLRRHYFDNYMLENANDQYVAVIDHGRDGTIPRYNIVIGTMQTIFEVLTAAQLLLAAPCFFKLPMGCTAIVDIYIPDTDDSDEPKTFDYQVFKAKLPTDNIELRARQFKELYDAVEKLRPHAGYEASGADNPQGSSAGRTWPLGSTGATGSVCYFASSGPSGPSNPCGGQTGITCANPALTVASCVNQVLTCITPTSALRRSDSSQSTE